MTDEARKARNEYRREWARRNPDKVRASQEKYWTRKAAEHEQRRPPVSENEQ